MRLSSFFDRLCCVGLAAFAFTACQGGAPFSGQPAADKPNVFGARALQVPGPLSATYPLRRFEAPAPWAPPVWMKPAPGTSSDYAYVSQFGETYVSEYSAYNRKNGPPICKISGQPYVNGIGVDAAGNFWVPQGGQMTGITTKFAPHCGKALLRIADTDGQPAAVAFDSKSNVYVENIMNAQGGQGNIDVYAPGTTKPKLVLQDSQGFLWFDEALDASDNLFMVYSDPYNKGHVVEFVHAKGAPKALPMTLGFPGGVTFDSSGNLLVVDQDAVNVSVYARPFTSAPIASFPLKADSVPCRFAQGKVLLYCADFTNASVDVYRYDVAHPSSTAYLYSFTNGIVHGAENAGIALDPAPKN